MSDLERFKEYVNRVCPFPSELLDEFKLVRDNIETVDDITEDDWKGLMVEFDANNIMWNETFEDKNGTEVKVGDMVMWTNPEDDERGSYMDKYKLCKVENITEDSIILKDNWGEKIEASEDECEYHPKIAYGEKTKEDVQYGVTNVLQEIGNARSFVSYIHNHDDLKNELDNMLEWFKHQVEHTVAKHLCDDPF